MTEGNAIIQLARTVERSATSDGYVVRGQNKAHRILTTLVVTGTRVFGRAFAEAYKQASASSKYATEMKKGNVTGASTYASNGLTLDEACKILNVKPPQAAAGREAQLESVMERFKKLFDINDPEKGGSFYLQSKILRARERIEMELRETERKVAMDKELKEGWKPKVYKDR
uniref:Mitochondrial import inner membrane translocase subunit TIM16 n=1 Tax=Talaromyces marneffei PM1 TaxID=1077442 RepID=A0A093UQ71_TALMA